jgi:8-oxo-dGTP pyrophosphatase MutT (NUDIX family)
MTSIDSYSYCKQTNEIRKFSFAKSIDTTVQDKVLADVSNSNSKLAKWLANCEKNNINIENVHIDAVTMFGPNVGFVYLTANATDINGKILPGTAFIRGGAVCCLLLIKNSDTKDYFMVVVEEIKVPVGASVIQTPAGMKDSDNNIRGKIIDEIKEETGIVVSNNLVYHKEIDHLQSNTLIQFDGFYPSQGGCDEFIDVFAYVTELTSSQLEKVNGRQLGNANENEMIKVHVKSLEWSVIDKIQDSKLLVAASKFDRKFPGIIMP